LSDSRRRILAPLAPRYIHTLEYLTEIGNKGSTPPGETSGKSPDEEAALRRSFHGFVYVVYWR
jgi:hypothetical protein